MTAPSPKLGVVVVTVLVVCVVGAVNFKAVAAAADAALVAALRENAVEIELPVLAEGGIGANDDVAAVITEGSGAAVVPIKFIGHVDAAVAGGRSK